ncbi:hypothetical protein E8E13_011420 [Curvularia kusanoi]|uniref:Uncharacterized protein n=1 Tax=Curvularia kusanoi TaxID=90978 RepID=A0A9P4TP05_CURKU|nr:hypothetical protein E8E13_011420 [Curvularia kusanoi]
MTHIALASVEQIQVDTSREHTSNFARLPGEIRNTIYEFVIRGLPRSLPLTVLPAISFVNTLVQREFLSKFLPYVHCYITSMLDIWNIGAVLNMILEKPEIYNISRLTVNNYTSIAFTQSRANEIMDFLCRFSRLHTLVLGIALGDLYHGFRGRIKELNHVLSEYELFRIRYLKELGKLVIKVKRDGGVLAPDSMTLLLDLKDWFAGATEGEVLLTFSE